jgi:hypothetical protein
MGIKNKIGEEFNYGKYFNKIDNAKMMDNLKEEITHSPLHTEINIYNIVYEPVKYCENCRMRKGEDHPNWQGGISYEPYCPKFTNMIKDKVRNHFNNECVLCGKSQGKRKLSVHHVNYNKGQGCSGNWLLVPLCASCHTKTNTNRDYWEDYFTTFLSEYNFDCGVKL